MKRIINYWTRQYGNPKGILGKICCIGMRFSHNKIYRIVLKEFGSLNKSDSVLEIVCGESLLISNTAKESNCEIIGVDIFEDALSLARKRNKNKLSNICF